MPRATAICASPLSASSGESASPLDHPVAALPADAPAVDPAAGCSSGVSVCGLSGSRSTTGSGRTCISRPTPATMMPSVGVLRRCPLSQKVRLRRHTGIASPLGPVSAQPVEEPKCKHEACVVEAVRGDNRSLDVCHLEIKLHRCARKVQTHSAHPFQHNGVARSSLTLQMKRWRRCSQLAGEFPRARRQPRA